MEMSQIATGVAWRPFQSTFWLRSQGSLRDPASQDGKFRLSFGGPIRRAHFLSRPSSAPPAASDPRHSCWEATARVAGFSLWALQEGPGCWLALAAFLLGRLLEVTAQPQNDQLLFLCHTGHQKGIIALRTLILLPLLGVPAVSHSPGLCGQLRSR